MKGSDEKIAKRFISHLTLISNHLWWLALMAKISLAGSVLYLLLAMTGEYEGVGIEVP